jgi:Chalcone isomerase-like
MRRFYRVSAIAVLIAVASSPVRAAECIGATMPDEYQIGSDTLVLNGLGARLASMLKVEVYVAGLYLKEHVHDPQAIIATDQPRHLELDFLRDVSRKQITDAWSEGFKKNSGDKFASLAADIAALNAAMTDLPKGSKLTFSYRPGAGTTVAIDQQNKATIAGADFASALIAIWLGDPPNKEIKTGLLGGDCD